MNYIEVASVSFKPLNQIQITWLIKQVYSVKLHYPDGIEIDIPRTYRSVYKFGFTIDSKMHVCSEHWNWLIQSVHNNYPYNLILNNSDPVLHIQHANKAITIGDSECNCFYLPLEYAQEEFINACKKMYDIFSSADCQLILNSKTGLIMVGTNLWHHPEIQEICKIDPLEFPVFRFKGGLDPKVNCYISHINKHVLPINTAKVKDLYEWLNSDNSSFTYNQTIVEINLIKRSDCIVINSSSFLSNFKSFSISNRDVHKLKECLAKSLSL